jgi:uncharacterized protein YjiS (DUF1127 family)
MTTLVQGKKLQGSTFLHALAVIAGQMQKWIDIHHQRKQLALLDEHMLQDIGINKEYVKKEINKPFWK